MNILIVTGLSGAGKSMAVKALEDIGFFCIDNISFNFNIINSSFAHEKKPQNLIWSKLFFQLFTI